MSLSRRVFLLSSTATLLSAEPATVRVRVTDETGARIAGAEVIFINAAGEHIATLHTDNRGEASYTGATFRKVQITSPGMVRYILAGPENAGVFEVMLKVSRGIVDWTGSPPPAIGRVRVHVTDVNGRPVANAHGWTPTGDKRIVTADASGDVLFTGVTLGQTSFVIAADGLPSRVLTAVLSGADELSLGVRLAD